MSGDIREAFHLAAAKYLFWNKLNNEQSILGWLDAETGKRRYLDEPTVPFFGKQRSLSEICQIAEVLTGALPDHMAYLFKTMVDGSGAPEVTTYPEAVELLHEVIEVENDRPEYSPLTEPSLIEKVREDALKQHAEACHKAIDERIGGVA